MRIKEASSSSGSPLVSDSLELVLQPQGERASEEPIRLVERGVVVAGRSSSAHYKLPDDDKRHSRLHFVVEFNPPLCRLLDLGSRNGTFVNGEKVFSTELFDGDVIQAGVCSFKVQLQGGFFSSSSGDESGDSGERRVKKPADSDEDEGDFRTTDLLATHSITKGDTVQRDRDARPKANASAKPPVRPASGKEPSEQRKSSESVETSRSLRKQRASEQLKRLTQQPQSPEFDIDQLLASESLVDQPVAPGDADFDIEQGRDSSTLEIEGFELLRSVGIGRIGEVYEARRLEDGQRVALKVMRTPKANEPESVQAFLSEMQPLLELDHPNIVKYHAFGSAPGCVYAVTDFVDGIDAQRLVRNDGALGVARVAKLGGQVLMALDYAHGLGFVHRDIKPSNLLVTEGNNRELCLLSDFGLARTFQNSPLFGVKMKSDLEQSVRFMAPEQFLNFKEAPLSVDIYSLGATLYYLLTGKYIHDFESLSFDQSVNKIKRDDAIPLVRRRYDVPPEMANLIHASINRFAQKRVATAAAFRKELYKFVK
jgi:serine/threonine-protein kinase